MTVNRPETQGEQRHEQQDYPCAFEKFRTGHDDRDRTGGHRTSRVDHKLRVPSTLVVAEPVDHHA